MKNKIRQFKIISSYYSWLLVAGVENFCRHHKFDQKLNFTLINNIVSRTAVTSEIGVFI